MRCGISPDVAHSRQLGQLAHRELTAGPLVGQRAVDVAVADDDGTALQRRPDDLGNVVRAVGGVEHRLGSRRHRRRRVEQQRADRGTDLRRTGLAGDDDLDALRLEQAGEQGDLRGLAGPLAALEHDEDSAARAAAVPRSAEQCEQVSAKGHSGTVVQRAEGQHPDSCRQQTAQQQRHGDAVDLDQQVGAGDLEAVLVAADDAGQSRRDGDRQQQADPHQRVDEPEGATAELVRDLAAEKGQTRARRPVPQRRRAAPSPGPPGRARVPAT